MLNNSLNFESLRILHHMVFTLAMKYFRYQGQHSDVVNHVTMPEHFRSLCKQVLINSNKIKAAGKTLLWVILQWPVYFFLLKIKEAVHWRNLGDWGEFGCLKRKATKICMMI